MSALVQTTLAHPLTAILVLWVVVAALIDFRTRRIPNLLSVGGLAVALLVQFAGHGWDGVINGLTGAATGFFIYLILYAVGAMGAGDVKLMAAVGAFLGGPANALLAVILSMSAGVAVSLLLLCIRGGIRDYLSRYGLMLKHLFLTGQLNYIAPQPGSTATQRFPYAFAIAIGALATLWLGGNFDPFLLAFHA
jgi:prepilin peptidase CpaA